MTAATRRNVRFRPIHFVLSLLLAFAGVFAFAAPAQAVAGQIDGTLTDTTLAPGSIFLDGLTVRLYDGAGDFVDEQTTSGGGQFSFTGLPDDGYEVEIDGGADYMYEDFYPVTVNVGTPASGSLGLINLTPATQLMGTVRDSDGNLLDEVYVIVQGQPSGINYYADTYTDGTGEYSVKVPGGEDYSLLAFEINFDYWDQIYNHLAITCGCNPQPVTSLNIPVGHADVGGLDFEMHPWWHVQFDILATDLFNSAIPNLDIHLYKKVSGGYAPVEGGTTHNGSDDSGYLTSYGPGDGDYRLRFSNGSNYVPADGWFDDYTSTGGLGGCYIDFNGLLDGNQFEMEITFNTLAVSTCGPEPAVVSGGGGGSGGGSSTPPKKRTTTFTGTFVAPTPTPTPSATPTSSPSPSSSPSGEPSASPESTPDPEPTGNPLDLWWLWLILAAILALIVFFLVRLIRGRT